MELTSDQRYRLKDRDLINERKRTRHGLNRNKINAKRRGCYIGNTAAKVPCPKCGKQFSKCYLATHLEYWGSDARPAPMEKVACSICDKMVCKSAWHTTICENIRYKLSVYFLLHFHSIELHKTFLVTRCVDCNEQEAIWLFPRLFEQSILLSRLEVEHDLFPNSINFLTACWLEHDRVAAGSALL